MPVAEWEMDSKPTKAQGVSAATWKIWSGTDWSTENGGVKECHMGRAENDQDAEEQQERENRLRVRGEPFASDYQRAEQDDGGVGKQDLAEPDVIAGYAVMEAELEHAAEEIPHDQ